MAHRHRVDTVRNRAVHRVFPDSSGTSNVASGCER
ncbi:hypothetical protein SGPA1_11717 [Streptomyces misionensis JCM 4497]